MDVQLFAHGVPSGESFWGPEDDRNYFGTFYDGSSDEIKFLIQVRSLRGKAYCYYNYLVYRSVGSAKANIVGNDGRDGSYFGISLRMDAYCKDVVNMYRILDTLYNVFVIGKILKPEKSNLKYAVTDFKSISAHLGVIEQEAIQLIKNAFSLDSFIGLNGFALEGKGTPTYNLYDCTAESVLAALKKYSRIAISPYYPSNKESAIQQQYQSQIQQVQQQCDARLKADAEARSKEKSEYTTSLSSVKSQVGKLQAEIAQKDTTISNQKKEISRLEGELRSIGQHRKIEQILAPIKEPINKLSDAIQAIVPTPNDDYKGEHHGGRGRRFSISKVCTLLIPSANLLLLLLVAGALLNPFKKNVFMSSEKHTIDSLENKIMQLEEELTVARTSGTGTADNPFENPFDINDVKIDISPYSGGSAKLSKNTEYTVRAIGGSEQGKWSVSDASITETEDPDMIKIKPNGDDVTITYTVGDKKKERKLQAQ